MELLEGHDLAELLAQAPGGLPAGEAVELGLQIADALAAAHEQGVVHRDLRPGNVFLHEGRVKICDFGIARAANSTTGLPFGTPPYMVPEQWPSICSSIRRARRGGRSTGWRPSVRNAPSGVRRNWVSKLANAGSVWPSDSARLEARLDGANLSGGNQFLQVLRLQKLQGFRFDAVVAVDIKQPPHERKGEA